MKSLRQSLAILFLVIAPVILGARPGSFIQDGKLDVLIKALSSEDFEEQGKAAKVLERMGSEILDPLRKLQEDSSVAADVRDWCRKIADRIVAVEKRFKALLEKLASDDDEVKEAAELELKKIGAPSIPFLKAALKSDLKNLRKRAARVLEALGSADENGGGGGKYSSRFGGRENLAARGGGTRATESAVLAALKWLARHQGPDGSWAATGYSNECVGAKCVGGGDSEFDVGLTGLSLLAFLGAGYSHLSKDEYADPAAPGKVLQFGEVVKNGLKWLMSKQDPDGCVGARGTKYMYNHAIAALALSEAYGMTAVQLFKGPAQQATDFLIASQNPDRAWRYTKRAGDNDTSVTSWAIMALRSAELSELKVPAKESYEKALKWLDEVTDATIYHRVGYNGKSSGKVFMPGKNENFVHHETMTAAAVMCRIFMSKDKKDPALGGVQLLVKDVPQWKDDMVDFYYWYYASMAIFQYDGPDGPYWKKWNEPMKNALVPNQKAAKDGCANGSWNPAEDRWGFEGGRVYATALNALTLETYYRYPRALK